MKGLNIRENLNNSFISSDLVKKNFFFFQLMYIKQNHNKRNIKVLDVLGGPDLVPMFIVLRSEVIFRFVRSVF